MNRKQPQVKPANIKRPEPPPAPPEKLKPCHRCKSKLTGIQSFFFESENKIYYYMECIKCGNRGFERKTIEGARKIWNREN